MSFLQRPTIHPAPATMGFPSYSSVMTSPALSRFRAAGYHRPFFHYRFVSFAAFLLLFVAFILFLLVGLSLPIIKSIYLLKLNASPNPNQPKTSVASTLTFGVWGFCATRYVTNCLLLGLCICIPISFYLLLTPSVLDGPENFDECFGPQLGYTIPANVVSLIGLSPSVVQILLNALVVLLVLHPVAASLSFLTFINSHFLGHHAVSIVALILAIITSLVSTAVFAVDLALVLVAKANVKNINIGTFNILWGNAVWMVLVATLLTWIAVGLLSARACYCCGVRR